VIPE